MRLNKIGFQWGETNQKYELVSFHDDGKTHHVIAFFERHREGYDMRTVSDRFFADHDAWIVAKHAMAFLEAVFQASGNEEEK